MVDLPSVLSEARPFVWLEVLGLCRLSGSISLSTQVPDGIEGIAHLGNSHCDLPLQFFFITAVSLLGQDFSF